MQVIKVSASKNYEVHIGSGLLSGAGERISALFSPCRIMVVSDETVFSLYGKALTASLEKSGFECSSFVFECGEKSKSFSTVEKLLLKMAAEHFSRRDVIVALGGGVVGDLGGFAASIFLRGISYVQIPTTLLAAVDSSVGGKTAVNLSGVKNLCGAFHQPSLVLCDTDTLKTLSESDFKNGLAEMLKCGIIRDSDLFEKVENYKENDIEALIARAVEIKRDIVALDEFDRGERMLLNFGHTVGHAIEAASGFDIPHGAAVAAGMAIIARATEKNGLISSGTAQRICTALERLELPTGTDFDADTLANLALSDKKSSGNAINIIIPLEIGKAVIHKVAFSEVKDLIEAGK